MRKIIAPALILLSATFAACGGTSFEWFPPVTDTSAPLVTATIAGNTIFNNRSTHVTLPASVSFSASEPATIYYTTNGTDPTTASDSVVISSGSATGPSITLTNTILKFFGIDTSVNLNKSDIQKGYILSP